MSRGQSVALDLRLVPAAVAAWSLSFLAVRVPPVASAALAAALLLVAGRLVWSLGGRGGRRRDRAGPTPQATALLTVLAAALVLVSAAAQLHQRSAGLLDELVTEGAVITLRGTVTGDPATLTAPAERGGGTRVTVRVRADEVVGRGLSARARAPVLVLGPPSWQDVALGQELAATGRLVRADPGDAVIALVIVHGEPQTLAAPPAHHRLANRMRAGLIDAVAGLAPQAQGLVPGIAVGDDSRMPADLDAAMKAVSLTHITAVSGAHVAIVLGSVLAALAWTPRWLRAGLGVALLVCFVVLVRPEASVLRAATMGGVGLAALLLGRPSRALPALCSAVVLLLVVDPWLAGSYGFVLSVLATGGLVVLAGPWAAVLSRWLPRTLAHVLAVPAAAQVCCAPVIILLEPAVATYAIPANALAVPALPVATVLGVVATVLSPWLPGLTAVLATAAGWCTAWIAEVALFWAALPGAQLPWPAGVLGAGLLALLTVLGFVIAGRGPRVRLSALAVASVVALLVLVPGPRRLVQTALAGIPPDWAAVQCDVGQGSGFVLRSPAGRVVMVDVGPADDAAAHCLRMLGVREVDLLVLSHLHADHVGGLPEVLAAATVHRALLTAHDAPVHAERAVLEALAEAGAAVERPLAGAEGRLDDVIWHVLWPTARAMQLASAGDDSVSNDLSLAVLLHTPDLTVAAPGDLEPSGQRGLLGSLPPSTEVDVVLVPHHGSPAQLPALADALAAPLALVSVGADNDFGHPSPATVELYSRGGALVLRTDECGPIVLVPTSGGLAAHC